MQYLASLEVDQRQRLIRSADQLPEMLGGSWSIEDTVRQARNSLGKRPIRVLLPVSGLLWFQSPDAIPLGTIEWLKEPSRNVKDRKAGETGECPPPPFVPCPIQPNHFANHWAPERRNDPQNGRRAMMSTASREPEERAHGLACQSQNPQERGRLET